MVDETKNFLSDLIAVDVEVLSSIRFHRGRSAIAMSHSHTSSISARSNIMRDPVSLSRRLGDLL
jgi:hypothetical protein